MVRNVCQGVTSVVPGTGYHTLFNNDCKCDNQNLHYVQMIIDFIKKLV